MVAWRLLVRSLIFPLSDTAIAMHIERRFPQFEERLSSSVQFLNRDRDERAGSPELQQQVIAETLERAAAVDFQEVVDFSPAVPAIVAAAGIMAVALGLAVVWPTDAAIAVRRLFVPYSAPAWPRQTSLRLLTADFRPIDPEADSPITVIRGQKLELLVEDRRGRALPDDVSLEYRMSGEPAVKEALRHVSLTGRGQSKSGDYCVISLPAERGPVWFRASGGDDDTMPELEMRVVLSPRVDSLRVTLTPPRYTNRPAETLLPGDGRIRGVVGTLVSFQAKSSKPLASASLMVKGKPAGTTTVESTDSRGFRGTFVLSDPGTYAYSFRLKDSEGVEGGDSPRYEIEALPDAVPEVAIDEPSADATVTADAQLPITVSAKDDFGLREMRLRFHIGDNAEAAHTSTVPLATDLPRPQHHRVSFKWRLGDLSVSEGMRIVFHAEATDWFDLGPTASPSVPRPPLTQRLDNQAAIRAPAPVHLGKSASRILTIISAKQKEAEIVSRQADVLRSLERAEQAQSRHSRSGRRSQRPARQGGQTQSDRRRRIEAGSIRSAAGEPRAGRPLGRSRGGRPRIARRAFPKSHREPAGAEAAGEIPAGAFRSARFASPGDRQPHHPRRQDGGTAVGEADCQRRSRTRADEIAQGRSRRAGDRARIAANHAGRVVGMAQSTGGK